MLVENIPEGEEAREKRPGSKKMESLFFIPSGKQYFMYK